jgi:hypothetical protein
MPDVPRSWQILIALQTQLQTIAIAGGYRTNAGADVRLEPSQFDSTDAPRITLYSIGMAHDGDPNNRGQRVFTLVIEAVVSAALESPHATIVALSEDIEQSLHGFVPMPGALPLLFEESLILDRPDGLDAMVVQHRYATRFRR